MDRFQLRAVEAVSASVQRLREGGFAEPALALEEIKRLASMCEADHSRYVSAWVTAHEMRNQSQATRQRSRLARLRSERSRLRLGLSLIDFGEPAGGP